MTFNTGNPIGSTDARDLSDNAENFDKALGTLDATWTDRLGVTRDSFEGRLEKGSFYRVGTFAAGYTLTNMRQTLEYSGHEYSWAGTFPKIVAAGTNPSTSGGIGAGAWVDRTDVTLRADLASGDYPELLPYKKRTIPDALSESVYIEDYRDTGGTDQQALQAAYDSLPPGGGEIKLSNQIEYLIDGFVNTKPFFKLSGNGKIKSPPSNTTTPAILCDVIDGVVEVDGVSFDGDKYNQTGASKNGLHIKNASRVLLNNVKAESCKNQNIRIELCSNVTVRDCESHFAGLAVSNGDAINTLGIGLYIIRCDIVKVFGGNYSDNSYLGVRVVGYESVFSNPKWTVGNSVSVGNIRLPNGDTGVYAECITAGVTGTVEPTWGTTDGATVSDGSALWVMRDPLCDDVGIFGVTADRTYGNYGTYQWGIGISSAVAKNVSIIGCKSRYSKGNNFDTNRVWNCVVIGNEGNYSEVSCGYNPDHSGTEIGLGGGRLKVVANNFNSNAVSGLLIQFSYNGTRDGAGDIIVSGNNMEGNLSSGLSATSFKNLKVFGNKFKNNGTTTQVAINEATATTEQSTTYRSKKFEFYENSFEDTRATKAQYNLWIGKYTDALHPLYNKIVVSNAQIQNNSFADYSAAEMYSGVTRGGVMYFGNAKMTGNSGYLGTAASPRTGFSTSELSGGYVDVTNITEAFFTFATAGNLIGFNGFEQGKILSVLFNNANTTIIDKDYTGGSGGNINLTNGTTLTPASGTIYRFQWMTSAWYQL